ncbi:MAG: DUF134 domain-containing protein [Deltaproteobacteria bacterium]|nr:DUF134 domain-containing protein [Deltaproteobacteria bacterium]MBW1932333.1 DUF134 domain-containing protein [Deltaproteobacteria bacterium]MBW1964771.1 DUF134 domain-containing protein [Deltaproteobacteria bacterium]MBW2079701.1 DUF134 domain-containing protein [Deltaproteobacteria bacterium]MBW2350132.1 DUF134 domain-containing protein [Deltaproteobacteria bacterium]
MARPPKWRKVDQEPVVTYFKPRGIPLRGLDEVVLTVEGFEALRMSDMEGMDQDAAAVRMGISRQTFGRILATARKTLSTAIVKGIGLRIEGGNYICNRSARPDKVASSSGSESFSSKADQSLDSDQDNRL